MSVMQCSSRSTADVVSPRRQCKYSCVSSANEWKFTPCSAALSARSAVYAMNSRGPSTEPCGTEHNTWTMADKQPSYTTRNVLPVRYDLNHCRTAPCKPNWRSSRSSSSSWSTVSKAAVRSSRQRADNWPSSAASIRSFCTFSTAVSVLWSRQYADCVQHTDRLSGWPLLSIRHKSGGFTQWQCPSVYLFDRLSVCL